LLKVRSLVQLLATTRSSLLQSGMGALMFENTDLRLGIAVSSVGTVFATAGSYTGRSVPANTCQASKDFAVRLRTMYIRSPNR
jgi:hypothetical protein